MGLSDPAASRAVLIGVHSYAKLPSLPAVGHNLADLREALTNPEIWGLPAEHCHVVDQPDRPGVVLNAVLEAGRQATDTLLVYYAGHGLTDQHDDELFLTLPDSEPRMTATALAYEQLRRTVRDPEVRALHKVVILDCCYSGRALEGYMSADTIDPTAVIDGTHVMTASSATQRAWSPPGERHTAFTGELVKVLDQGIPGGPGLLTTDTIYRHVHTELRAKSRPLPHQHNRNAGGDIVLARNRAEPGAQPPPIPPTAGLSPRVRRWIRLVLIAAVALLVIAAVALIVNKVADRGRVNDAAIPAGWRNCSVADPIPPGATSAYACEDRDNHPAVVAVYPDRKTQDIAYERAVGHADVPRSTGDCGTEQDGEHRYPVTGPAKGRVLCFTGETTTTVLWTDNNAHTVARIEVPAADLRTLRDSWTARTAPPPAFPTPAEQGLIDLPVATGCTRAGIREMDDFPGAIAAVTCTGTGGAGAQSVSYFRFDPSKPVEELQNTMNAHIPADKDPTGVGCEDAKAPKFTGGRPYDVRGKFLGVLLCHPAPDGSLVMEWSVEPLYVAARAVGSDATELAGWWRVNRGPPIEVVVKAVNERDKVPNAAEKDLLAKIPPTSQRLCMRPSGEYQTEHVHAYRITAGVVCYASPGPPIVFYYQFTDKKDLQDNYGPPSGTGGSCRATPTTVTGESAYSRGGATGRLRCEDRNGYLARIWTDERRLIQAFAFQGRGARAMTDWWEHDAGPI